MTAYTKEVVEVLSSSDSLGGWAFGRIVSESVSASDVLAKETGKLVSESTSISDSIVRDTQKLASESATISDTLKNTTSKLASESISSVDNTSLVNLYYTAKYITGDENTIEAAVEAYLATIGTGGTNIKAITMASISSSNLGVLIVHS